MNTKEKISIANSFGTAFLWAVIPLGIALIVVFKFSLAAFSTVFPAWFFPFGLLLEGFLWLITIIACNRYLPKERIQCRVGAVIMFFIPIPIYFLFSGAGMPPENMERIVTWSPYFAWGIPLLMLISIPLAMWLPNETI